MEKTAIQMAIEQMNANFKELLANRRLFEWADLRPRLETIAQQVRLLKNYLPVERQQIENSYAEGVKDTRRGKFITAAHYYNQTFNQPTNR